MLNKKRPGGLIIALTIVTLGICSCGKSEGTVSSEDALQSVTAEVMDFELAHAIKSALAGDESLSDTKINVAVKKGEVRLTGMVITQAQRERALRIATGVNGVFVVDDKLSVKAPH